MVISTGAQAKELRNSLEVQGFGQWVAVDANNSGLPWIQSDNGWGGGFTVGYNILDWLEVEFDYSHTRNDFRAPGFSNVCSFIVRCENKTNTFTFFSVFNIPAGEFVSPFLKFGIGGFVSDNPAWHTTGATVAAGGGVRIFPIPDNGLNLRFGADLAGFFPVTSNNVFIDALDESTFNVRVVFGLGYVIDFSR
jgi:hypothetical protein